MCLDLQANSKVSVQPLLLLDRSDEPLPARSGEHIHRWSRLSVTAGFYRSEHFFAELQRKKNQALFLPRPVRKYGFCSLGSLGGFMADVRSRLLFSPFLLTD
jgi:hypothetical protein